MKNLKDKKSKEAIDKNFIKSTSYDIAGEIGILDNEDMQKNKYINSNNEVIEDGVVDHTRTHRNKPR